MTSPCETTHDVPGTNCPCDDWVHPGQLEIDAGLESIPRQLAGFREFRRAMLAAIPTKPALTGWRPRNRDDLGVMLLEMWAYVCDVLAFYDETIAHECYLRTARRRPSVRRLTNLLGYRPRPAVASRVALAALVDGRKPVKLPQSVSFQSGGFDGEPPQVFELDRSTEIRPQANRWNLEPPDCSVTNGPISNLLVESAAGLSAGDAIMAVIEGQDASDHPATITDVSRGRKSTGQAYLRVRLDEEWDVPAGTLHESMVLYVPHRRHPLWRTGGSASLPQPVVSVGEDVWLTLAGVYRDVEPGHLAVNDGSHFSVVGVTEETVYVPPLAVPGTETDEDDPITTSPILAPVTRIRLAQATVDEFMAGPSSIQFLRPVRVLPPPKSSVGSGDSLRLSDRSDLPPDLPELGRFLFQDGDEEGFLRGGALDTASGSLTVEQDPGWPGERPLPLGVYGNVLEVSRGETVVDEVLGSGDAAVAGQWFALQNNPLTYLPAPTAENDLGVASTLEVYVNGVRWSEVPTFFGSAADAQVFVARQDDEGVTTVEFGDGTRGARVPTGADNVRANYRYGAGAASPPAGSITQIGQSFEGLASVLNPVAAGGGGDPESAEEIRDRAPTSAMILGRAVSAHDLEVAAASVSGVRAAAAEWRWSGRVQRPVVEVWVIADSDLSSTVLERLRAISDPSTPIVVRGADCASAELRLTVAVDARHRVADVEQAIGEALVGESGGILRPERLGVGRPLYRSRILDRVLDVPGARAVTAMELLVDSEPENRLSGYATTPGAGWYFDFETIPPDVKGVRADG